MYVGLLAVVSCQLSLTLRSVCGWHTDRGYEALVRTKHWPVTEEKKIIYGCLATAVNVRELWPTLIGAGGKG